MCAIWSDLRAASDTADDTIYFSLSTIFPLLSTSETAELVLKCIFFSKIHMITVNNNAKALSHEMPSFPKYHGVSPPTVQYRPQQCCFSKVREASGQVRDGKREEAMRRMRCEVS